MRTPRPNSYCGAASAPSVPCGRRCVVWRRGRCRHRHRRGAGWMPQQSALPHLSCARLVAADDEFNNGADEGALTFEDLAIDDTLDDLGRVCQYCFSPIALQRCDFPPAPHPSLPRRMPCPPPVARAVACSCVACPWYPWRALGGEVVLPCFPSRCAASARLVHVRMLSGVAHQVGYVAAPPRPMRVSKG